jgi:hypothetical protein
MEETKCLEAKIVAEIVSQRKEADKRENILIDRLKEISEDFNQLEVEFSQQERRLEE